MQKSQTVETVEIANDFLSTGLKPGVNDHRLLFRGTITIDLLKDLR